MNWDRLTTLLNKSVTSMYEVGAVLIGGVDNGQTVRGVFTNYHIDVNMGEPGLSDNDPIFECSDSADYASALKLDQRVQIKGIKYKIIDVQPDGQGWTDYILEAY